MGEYTYAEPVAFKVVIWDGDASRLDEKDVTRPEIIRQFIKDRDSFNEQHWKNDVKFQGNYNGWKVSGEEKIGEISATKLTKDNYFVFEINESKYAAVGCYTFTIFSNDRLSLERFLDDWKLSEFKKFIKGPAAVMQTI